MESIEILVNQEKDCLIYHNKLDYYNIGNPEKVSLGRSLNKWKRNLILMYKGPNIPKKVKQQLAKLAKETGLNPDIMSREVVYLPHYNDVWNAEIPDNFQVTINYSPPK